MNNKYLKIESLKELTFHDFHYCELWGTDLLTDLLANLTN